MDNDGTFGKAYCGGKRLDMNLDRIPDDIKTLRQWVCTKGDRKVPMIAGAGRAASSTDESTWSCFDTARASVESGYDDYVGFVFNDNGIVGIDIDDGFDEDGFISPLAADIIGRCKSYTEKSKSGRGFHILLYGTLPFKGKNNLKVLKKTDDGKKYFLESCNSNKIEYPDIYVQDLKIQGVAISVIHSLKTVL